MTARTREAERQAIFLQWVQEQIPLLELELNQSNRIDTVGRDKLAHGDEKNTTSQRESRKRHRDVSPEDGAPMKRSRHVNARRRPSPGEDDRDAPTTIVRASGGHEYQVDDGSTREKGKRSLDTDGEHSRKRAKQETMHQESIPPGSTAVLAQVREKPTRPHHAIDRDDVQGSQAETTRTGCPSRSVDSGLRRSARIAARQNTFPVRDAPRLRVRPAEPRGSSSVDGPKSWTAPESGGKGVPRSSMR